MNHGDVRMAVLVQPLVEADFAFVSHTVNPSTGDKNQVQSSSHCLGCPWLLRACGITKGTHYC